MRTVQDIYDALDRIAPFATQCDWDNSGLLVGDAAAPVKRIGFVLDLTTCAVRTAQAAKVDLLVTHHPVIFRAQKRFLKGDSVFELARAGISVISTHTPWDSADGGVNDVICELLGLRDVRKIASDDTPTPMLRLGRLERTCSAAAFAAFSAEKFGTTVRLGDCGNDIQTVAVCGGAAMEFAETARRNGADLFLTGDVKHHELLDAVESGISIVAAGHFETERLSMAALKDQVQACFSDVTCLLLDEENPIRFVTASETK